MTQVRIFSSAWGSSSDVERQVNSFLLGFPNIQMQSIQLSSTAFDTKVMIVYTTEEPK